MYGLLDRCEPRGGRLQLIFIWQQSRCIEDAAPLRGDRSRAPVAHGRNKDRGMRYRQRLRVDDSSGNGSVITLTKSSSRKTQSAEQDPAVRIQRLPEELSGGKGRHYRKWPFTQMEKRHCHFEYRKLYLARGIGINNAKGLKGTETANAGRGIASPGGTMIVARQFTGG